MSWSWPILILMLAAPDASVPSVALGGDDPVPPTAEGPPPEVSMTCAPDPVRIGDTLACEVSIEHRSDWAVNVIGPEIFRISDTPAVNTTVSGAIQTIQPVTYRVRSLKKVMVRGLKVRWTEPNGAQGIVDIPDQRIPFESMLIDTLAEDRIPRTFRTPNSELTDADAEAEARLVFLDAHGPVEYRRTEWSLVYGLLGLLLFLLGPLVWLIVQRLRRHFWPPETDGPWVDPRPAHVIAYEQLDRLKSERLPEQDLHEAYYVRISEIFRGYLKRRFEINGLEMTSEEIRRWSEAHLAADVRAPLHAFLSDTDIVKFANVVPNTEELEAITGQAETFIEDTLQPNDSEEAQSDPDVRAPMPVTAQAPVSPVEDPAQDGTESGVAATSTTQTEPKGQGESP